VDQTEEHVIAVVAQCCEKNNLDLLICCLAFQETSLLTTCRNGVTETGESRRSSTEVTSGETHSSSPSASPRGDVERLNDARGSALHITASNKDSVTFQLLFSCDKAGSQRRSCLAASKAVAFPHCCALPVCLVFRSSTVPLSDHPESDRPLSPQW
jgi:hypothetical protein